MKSHTGLVEEHRHRLAAEGIGVSFEAPQAVLFSMAITPWPCVFSYDEKIKLPLLHFCQTVLNLQYMLNKHKYFKCFEIIYQPNNDSKSSDPLTFFYANGCFFHTNSDQSGKTQLSCGVLIHFPVFQISPNLHVTDAHILQLLAPKWHRAAHLLPFVVTALPCGYNQVQSESRNIPKQVKKKKIKPVSV